MISAHIYSTEALPRPQERAVRDGLEMVADHIGEKLVAWHYRIQLPSDEEGFIDPDTQTFPRTKFDKRVDLHIIVAHLALSDATQHGLAYIGSGVAFVEAEANKRILMSTTAHETAHALYFVRKSAPHKKDSYLHCRSRDCLMRPLFDHENRRHEDFCRHCREDLANFGVEHIEKLREYRSRGRKLSVYD